MADRIKNFAFIFLGLIALVPYSLGIDESVTIQGGNGDAHLVKTEEGSPTGNIEIAKAAGTVARFEGRDPFWPVGYMPPAKQDGDTAAGKSATAHQDQSDQSALDLSGLSEEEQRVIRERMRLGGVLQQAGEIWAIINNQLVKQGETITVDTSRKNYLFLVKHLTPDRIVLESKMDP